MSTIDGDVTEILAISNTMPGELSFQASLLAIGEPFDAIPIVQLPIADLNGDGSPDVYCGTYPNGGESVCKHTHSSMLDRHSMVSVKSATTML